MSKVSRSSFLNENAVKNHLALPVKLAKNLSSEAKSIDTLSKSVVLTVVSNDHCGFDVVDAPIAMWREQQVHGVSVIHSIGHRDPRVGVRCTVPWHTVIRNAPDAGHVVYGIELATVSRLLAEIKQGGVVFATKEAVQEAKLLKKSQDVPLEMVIGDRAAYYIGKTSVGIARRLKQHVNSSVKGARTRFHKAIAGKGCYQPMLPHVRLIDCADTEEKAYDLEETYIQIYMHDGAAYVLNTASTRQAILELKKMFPDLFDARRREEAPEMLQTARSGGVNPWDDPAYAEAVICNNDRNFDSDEVRQIRMLRGLGSSPAQIARVVGAKPPRILKVLEGATYARVL